jgi:hypothetical protein
VSAIVSSDLLLTVLPASCRLAVAMVTQSVASGRGQPYGNSPTRIGLPASRCQVMASTIQCKSQVCHERPPPVQHAVKTVCLTGVLAGLLAASGCATRTAPEAAPETAGPPPASQTAGEGGQQVSAPATPARPPGFARRLATLLGGDSDTPNVGPCPAVRILYDASRFVELTGATRFDNVGFTGEMNGVRSECRYLRDEPIRVELEIDAAFGRGPQAAGQSMKPVIYWVAVTQVIRSTDPISGQPQVIDIGPLARQRFTTNVVFPQGADRVAHSTEAVSVMIPRAREGTSGENFEVIVGFDLTDEQLTMNRNGIRFRFDAGAQ